MTRTHPLTDEKRRVSTLEEWDIKHVMSVIFTYSHFDQHQQHELDWTMDPVYKHSDKVV